MKLHWIETISTTEMFDFITFRSIFCHIFHTICNFQISSSSSFCNSQQISPNKVSIFFPLYQYSSVAVTWWNLSQSSSDSVGDSSLNLSGWQCRKWTFNDMLTLIWWKAVSISPIKIRQSFDRWMPRTLWMTALTQSHATSSWSLRAASNRSSLIKRLISGPLSSPVIKTWNKLNFHEPHSK